jgi:hypothetical protein
MRHRSLGVVLVLAACGGSTPTPAPKVPENAPGGGPTTTQTREQVVHEAILAVTAGDVDKLMALADPKAFFELAIACKDGGEDLDARSVGARLRSDFARSIEKTRGTRVEVVSIKNEARGWTTRRSSRYASNSDRNATFVGKGGSVSKGCSARVDLLFHEIDVRVRLTKGNESKEARVRFDLVHGGGRWFLVKVPEDFGEVTGAAALAKMEEFQKQMCACKDKACADKVNEDMTRWGTEMAKRASYDRDEKPDPEIAKRSADIMTLYVECMTKLMMAGAGAPTP